MYDPGEDQPETDQNVLPPIDGLRISSMGAPSPQEDDFSSGGISAGPNAAPWKNPISVPEYNPSTAAQDRFQHLIDTPPQFDKPSAIHRIGAALIGAAYGPDAAMRFNMAGHEAAMNQWRQQLLSSGQAAADETRDNAIQRQNISSARLESEKAAALEETARKNREADAQKTASLEALERHRGETEAAATERNRINAAKQATADWIAHNPEGKVITDETTKHVILVDPRTGKKTDTGIHSQHDMSDYDKETAIINGAMDRTIQSGKDALNRANVAAGAHLAGIDKTNEGKYTSLAISDWLKAQQPFGPPPPTVTTTGQETKTQPLGSIGALLGIPMVTTGTKDTSVIKGQPGQVAQVSSGGGGAEVKIPEAKDIPVEKRVANVTHAMVANQEMVWNGHSWNPFVKGSK